MASRQQKAKLRICASCEWVFRWQEKKCDCPKCGFATYGARWVCGDRAYKYERTQQPWMEKKMDAYRFALMQEIEASKAERGSLSDLLVRHYNHTR